MSRGRERGVTLVEVVLAVTVLAIAVLGAVAATLLTTRQLSEAREAQLATLALRRTLQMVQTVKFRGDSSSDTTEWLFRGNYELARNANGTTFLMPDLRSSSTVSDDNGISGCVMAEFPVPGLVTPAGRTHPGRIYFYVNETTMPSNHPTATFPFPRTTTPTALTKIDCDGDGALTTTNLRVAYTNQTNPCRLIPCKVQVQWRGTTGRTEQVEEFALLAFQGVK